MDELGINPGVLMVWNQPVYEQFKKSCVPGVLQKREESQGGFCWGQVNVQGCRGFERESHCPAMAGTYLLLQHLASQDSSSAAHGGQAPAPQRCCIAQQLSLLPAPSASQDTPGIADLGSDGPPRPLFYPPFSISLLLPSVLHRVTASFSEALMILRPKSEDLTSVHE